MAVGSASTAQTVDFLEINSLKQFNAGISAGPNPFVFDVALEGSGIQSATLEALSGAGGRNFFSGLRGSVPKHPRKEQTSSS